MSAAINAADIPVRVTKQMRLFGGSYKNITIRLYVHHHKAPRPSDVHLTGFGSQDGAGAVVGRLCPGRKSLCASLRAAVAEEHEIT
jgi:hypothetical protein